MMRSLSSISALKEFPLLNAEIDDKDLIIKEYYDIGIAVSAPGGLVVPVVRDADKLDFAGIEREIVRLGTKARDNQLGLDDLQGGSFRSEERRVGKKSKDGWVGV